MSDTEARLWSISLPPFLPCPSIPSIIIEWGSIIPLVCRLASYGIDYLIAREVAPFGRLSVGVFLPRYWRFRAYLLRLHSHESMFFDLVSTNVLSDYTVWEVRYGNAFPRANGIASAAIGGCLLDDTNTSRGKKCSRNLSQWTKRFCTSPTLSAKYRTATAVIQLPSLWNVLVLCHRTRFKILWRAGYEMTTIGRFLILRVL